MPNVDYADGFMGANPRFKRLAIRANKILDVARIAQSPGEVRDVCREAAGLAQDMKSAAQNNIEMAATALDLPTRYLGVDSQPQAGGGVLAGTPLAIQSNPSVEVRVTTFRTDSLFAGDFTITQMKMATIDLLVGGQPLPASMFFTGISLPPTSAPIVPGGSFITTGITNNGGATRRFLAGYTVLKLDGRDC